MRKILFLITTFISISMSAFAQYEHKGFEPQLRLSFDEGIDKYKNFSFGLDAIAAYRFNEYFRLGAGVGINYIDLLYEDAQIINGHYYGRYKESAISIPVFAHIKVDFIKTKVSPYLGVDVGYNAFIPFSEYAKNNKLGVFFKPAFGVDIHFNKCTLLVEVAYRYQMRTCQLWTNRNGNYSQITQSIGIQF